MRNILQRGDYKFGTEGFLLTYLKSFQFVLGADIEAYSKEKNQLFSKDNPCNIYFILSRPKVTIEPNSFQCEGQKVNFDLIIHQANSHGIVSMGMEIPKAKAELKLITKYPYNLFSIKDEESTYVVARPSSLIDALPSSENIDCAILDYEVLYIGQSYGDDGSRTAVDRLLSHETLQKIYTHALTENPDNDIWILLTEFAQGNMLVLLGEEMVNANRKGKSRDNKLVKHFFERNEFSITEKQRINFTEAALIRYFEPKYNIEFKNTFPNKNHKSYSECYKMDLRALNIELDTSEMARNLFTEKSGRKGYHSAMFEFSNDNDRISFLGLHK